MKKHVKKSDSSAKGSAVLLEKELSRVGGAGTHWKIGPEDPNDPTVGPDDAQDVMWSWG